MNIVMNIVFKMKGDFEKALRYFKKTCEKEYLKELNDYGKRGIAALRSATPVDTGLTAASWYYEIEETSSGLRLAFYNSNTNKGVCIAIILQYGHATRNGGWVEGRDYINPAIQPIFDELAESVWKELSGL